MSLTLTKLLLSLTKAIWLGKKTKHLAENDKGTEKVPSTEASGAIQKRKLFLEFLVFLFKRETEIERQRQRMNGRGADREEERESQAGSALSAQSPMWGSNSRTMRSWPELKPRVRRLTNWATEVPPYCMFSDHSGIRLDVNNKKMPRNIRNIWDLSNVFINNKWPKEEIAMEIKKYC